MLAEYQKLIKTIVWRIAGHSLTKDDIDDVVQEVNLRLLDPARRPDHDPARGEVSAWIGTMARSMSIDALRKHGRMLPSSDVLDDDREEPGESLVDVSDDAITMLLREEQLSKLDSVIKSLPPDDQHFLIICLRDDYDNEAYAMRLGVQPVALRVRKMRLADKLRQMIRERKE